MSVHLENQVAIVTGASLGIGRATALALADSGAKVVINYRSSEKEAADVVRQIERKGGAACMIQADVAEHDQVESLVRQTIQQFGQLDIAIANAAFSDREFFYEANLDTFRRTVDVTMWGAFHLLRAASRQMISQKSPGAVVMVSSPHSFIPVPQAMAYNMSKAAMEHMAKTAAIELAPFDIRVNTIQPGWTDTPGERKYADEETLARAAAKIPLGRLGSPEEIAKGILVLCDPSHPYMTGASLLVDGGISLPWWSSRGSAAPE